MRFLSAALLLFAATIAISSAHGAAATMKMNYTNAEIISIIEAYSKASGQKFIVDPVVRGKVSIFLPEAVSTDEAFNHLSSALALNGFAISKQGDTMVVKSARNVQRDFIQTSLELPAAKPERMATWVYTVKNMPAESVNRDLRILTSKDGEMSVNVRTNQLIFTDWVSNLHRVSDLFAAIDKPVDAATAKLIAEGTKRRESEAKISSRSAKPSEIAPPPPGPKAKTEN